MSDSKPPPFEWSDPIHIHVHVINFSRGDHGSAGARQETDFDCDLDFRHLHFHSNAGPRADARVALFPAGPQAVQGAFGGSPAVPTFVVVRERDLRVKFPDEWDVIEVHGTFNNRDWKFLGPICSKFGIRPRVRCDFVPSEIENCVARSANGRTFVLTERSVGILSEATGAMSWRTLPRRMPIRPLFFKANCDGSVLMIGLRDSVWLIDDRHSKLDPDSVLCGLPILRPWPMPADEGLASYAAIEFHPTSPRYFVAAAPIGAVQPCWHILVYSVAKGEVTRVFDIDIGEGRPVSAIRFPPPDSPCGHSLFFAVGSVICCFAPFLVPGETDGDPQSKDDGVTRNFMFVGEPTRVVIVKSLLSSGASLSPIRQFDFFWASPGRFYLVAAFDGRVQYFRWLTWALSWEQDKGRDVPLSPGVSEQWKIRRSPHLYVHSTSAVYIVHTGRDGLESAKLIEANGIVGCGGAKPLAIVAPGYGVKLAEQKRIARGKGNFWCRSDPTRTDYHMTDAPPEPRAAAQQSQTRAHEDQDDVLETLRGWKSKIDGLRDEINEACQARDRTRHELETLRDEIREMLGQPEWRNTSVLFDDDE
jgi:hypothetical protein